MAQVDSLPLSEIYPSHKPLPTLPREGITLWPVL